MSRARPPLRIEFETARRRAAFQAFLPAAAAGIIAADTWVSHWSGFAGGFVLGGVAYGMAWGWESWMWRRHHPEPGAGQREGQGG
jgi:hypothetical protein